MSIKPFAILLLFLLYSLLVLAAPEKPPTEDEVIPGAIFLARPKDAYDLTTTVMLLVSPFVQAPNMTDLSRHTD